MNDEKFAKRVIIYSQGYISVMKLQDRNIRKRVLHLHTVCQE